LKPKVVTRLGGQPAQRLLRELGLQPAAGRLAGRPLADPRAVIAPFYSDEANSYPVIAYTPAQNSTIPFSLAPCRRMPLIAIGDENGCVRFLDISTDGTRCRLPSQRDSHNDDINDDDDDVWPPTSTYHDDPERRIRSRVKVHDNAIMSLAFSHDDTRLATACGDRNGAILDVATQAMAVSLENAHVGPMRQVTFQPGSAGGNVLATSDRNGCIQIWDLRYSTGAQPQHWSAHDPETRTYTSLRDDDLEHVLPTPIATADRAHARTVEGNTTGASVTALSWFSLAGREHILLSASEANASIRVWDTRFIRHHTHRGHSSAVPLSATRQPASHRWRSFGVTALALSDDAAASRLYAVCRDSTVYAYSAAHLMLGTVPELNSVPARPRRSHVGSVEDPSYVGLGPMYGFRHPQFRTQTFYVKCALRPSAAPGGAAQQMLAVGSSENCAVLFPTDERFVKAALAAPPPPAGATAHPNPAHHHTPSAGGLHSATPTHTPGGSGSFFGGFFSPSMGGDGGGLARHGGSEPDVPIVHCGAALVGGHSREVTHMGWAAGGEGLVSASDDCTVRHWRGDDRERARFLRTCGEGGNHRYGAGWADLGDYDEEDE
jgi:WD40 repeat protein